MNEWFPPAFLPNVAWRQCVLSTTEDSIKRSEVVPVLADSVDSACVSAGTVTAVVKMTGGYFFSRHRLTNGCRPRLL